MFVLMNGGELMFPLFFSKSVWVNLYFIHTFYEFDTQNYERGLLVLLL